MKKAIFAAFAVAGLMFLFFGQPIAQNNSGTQLIENAARQAAKDAGCLDGINGAFDFSTSIVGGCACGPAVTCARYEVVIYPKIPKPKQPFTLPRRLATVDLCGTNVISVTCN